MRRIEGKGAAEAFSWAVEAAPSFFANLALATALLVVLGAPARGQNPVAPVFPAGVTGDSDLLCWKNSGSTTLSATLTPSATSIPVVSGTGFCAPSTVSIGNEIIKISAVSANALTVASGGRGFDGTTAATHAGGATVKGYVPAYWFNRLAAEVKAVQGALGVNLGGVQLQTHASTHQAGGADALRGETLPTNCSNGQTLKSNGAGALQCASDDGGGGVAADAIGTIELNDGSDTPAAGDLVRVASGGSSFEYGPVSQADVTQHQAALAIGWSQVTSKPSTFAPSAHAASHRAGGSDELLVSGLGGDIADGQVPASAVTQHQASLALAASQVTSGQVALSRGGTGADLSATGGAGQVLQQSSAGGAVSVGPLPYSSLSSIPSTFAPSAHAASHGSAGADALSLAWSQITSGVPSTFAPSAHAASHRNGGADEVATATAGANAIPKAGAGGTLADGWIAESNVTQHQAALALAGSQITSGEVADARLPAGVTRNASAQTLTNKTINGASNSITNLNANELSSGTVALARGGTGADLSATGGAGHVLQQSSAGGAVSVGALPYSSLSSIPSTFAPSAHAASHGSAGADALSLAWSQITSGVPSTFTPSAHAASHRNGGADEVATATAGANAIPKAGAGGTLADGWIAESSVTQHQAALALGGAQITSGEIGDARIPATIARDSELHGDGANCASGEAAAGVDAAGAAQGCTAYVQATGEQYTLGLTERTTPTTPSANAGKIFLSSSTGKLSIVKDSGSVVSLEEQGGTSTTTGYQWSLSAQTSATLLASTHGLGARAFVAACFDGSGAIAFPGLSRNGSGDISMTSASAFTGTCEIRNGFADRYQWSFTGTTDTLLATTHQLGAAAVAQCFLSGEQVFVGLSRNGSGDLTATSATSGSFVCEVLQ